MFSTIRKYWSSPQTWSTLETGACGATNANVQPSNLARLSVFTKTAMPLESMNRSLDRSRMR